MDSSLLHGIMHVAFSELKGRIFVVSPECDAPWTRVLLFSYRCCSFSTLHGNIAFSHFEGGTVSSVDSLNCDDPLVRVLIIF